MSIKGVDIDSKLVSVIMPVYNTEKYLADAIESVLWQTYRNWELIIVDDASTDKSWTVLKRYAKQDPRIRIFKQIKRVGLSASLNFALKQAQGYYVARMDADDVSLPDRLSKQVAFLAVNPQVVAVGTQTELINDKGIRVGQKSYPISHADIYKRMLLSQAINASTLVTYTELLQEVGFDSRLFDSTSATLFKLIQKGFFANLPEILFQRRIHTSALCLRNPKFARLLDIKSRFKAIEKWGYKVTFRGSMAIACEFVAVSLMPEKWYKKFYHKVFFLPQSTRLSRLLRRI